MPPELESLLLHCSLLPLLFVPLFRHAHRRANFTMAASASNSDSSSSPELRELGLNSLSNFGNCETVSRHENHKNVLPWVSVYKSNASVLYISFVHPLFGGSNGSSKIHQQTCKGHHEQGYPRIGIQIAFLNYKLGQQDRAEYHLQRDAMRTERWSKEERKEGADEVEENYSEEQHSDEENENDDQTFLSARICSIRILFLRGRTRWSTRCSENNPAIVAYTLCICKQMAWSISSFLFLICFRISSPKPSSPLLSSNIITVVDAVTVDTAGRPTTTTTNKTCDDCLTAYCNCKPYKLRSNILLVE